MRLNRTDTLFKLAASVRGIYVPQFYDRLEGFGGAVYPNREGIPPKVARRVAMPDPLGYRNIVPMVEAVFDSATVEIRRGCTRGCR